jgi:hypothetical protein
MNGYYHIEEKRIVIRQDLTPDQKSKTCLHEIAHAVLQAKGNGFSREAQELIAESVAFVVCGHFGLDASEYSFGYLSSWKGDDVKMNELGAVIQEIATGLIEKVDSRLVL